MAASISYATTNEALAKVLADIDRLIGWAEADAEHAAENDAPATAKDDKRRAAQLRRARALLEGCGR